jgi:pyridoxine 5-phosphate synthase
VRLAERRLSLLGRGGSYAAWGTFIKRILSFPLNLHEISPQPIDTEHHTLTPAPRLSVNLNKIALLRNSRRTGVPDVLEFANQAHEAGADGITLHPRPDERHIRCTDVFELAQRIRPWRPKFELNVEGYPDDRLFDIVSVVRPEQCTLVPDEPDVLTSEKGWILDGAQLPLVKSAVAMTKQCGSRAILFVNPDPNVLSAISDTGADGIEIYTGSYAAAARKGNGQELLNRIAETGRRAADLGLAVNIGHDLNLVNLPPLLAAMPVVAEASIGHELMADALISGFRAAVIAYRAALSRCAAEKP